MTNYTSWYPSGQICHPPELPPYLRNVYDLKPIVGVPDDSEVIGIHAVIQAANRASGIPGMHDPDLLMGLADHLFSAQMAKYRSKYSLIVFPSDATYTPPILPAHISVTLEPVSGVPSDEETIKAQEAVRSYQGFSHVPSMFDPHVNMEISQHLFDLQMARYMRVAGESRPSEENIVATNNAGIGANAAVHHMHHSASVNNAGELMERSNQLAERFNALLERSNELVENFTHPTDQSNRLSDQLSQVLERLTQLVERVHQPTEQSGQLAERFNQLFEQFNQVVEQSNRPSEQFNQLVEQLSQPLQQSNHLAERSNQHFERSNQLLSQLGQPTQRSDPLAERLDQLLEGFNRHLQRSNELSETANQLAEQTNRSTESSNRLTEQVGRPIERLESVMKNINRVLVGIQHAIIRSHRGNTLDALDCLVNQSGETPGVNQRIRVSEIFTEISWSLSYGFLPFHGLDDIPIGFTECNYDRH
ncbi:unnamed protein product [Rhizoctonia solani]|uniref:Laminin domain protein n=1 Tax=Rhizoctonia solani TaxID=456999 RepID=A0A8H3GMK8_9AGAM|nr:unnamed protein product [Rhizoctonia solani]